MGENLIPDALRRIRKYGGKRRSEIAEWLNSTVEDLEKWEMGTPISSEITVRLLMGLDKEARRRGSPMLLKDLNNWGWSNKQIAHSFHDIQHPNCHTVSLTEVGNIEAMLTHWRKDGHVPSIEHFSLLERVVIVARLKVKKHHISCATMDAEFCCSKTQVRNRAHREHAFSAFQRAQKRLSNCERVIGLEFGVYTVRVDFDVDDPSEGFTFRASDEKPPVFFILLNSKLTKTKQKDVFYRELHAHVLPPLGF